MYTGTSLGIGHLTFLAIGAEAPDRRQRTVKVGTCGIYVSKGVREIL